MLSKSPRRALPAGAANRSRGAGKKGSARAAAAPQAIVEPKIDWVPLRIAPFFCTSKGYMCPVEKWKDAIHDEVRCIVERPDERPPDPFCPLNGPSSPPWSFDRGARGRWPLSISAMGISTTVAPGSIFVIPDRATPAPLPRRRASSRSHARADERCLAWARELEREMGRGRA